MKKVYLGDFMVGKLENALALKSSITLVNPFTKIEVNLTNDQLKTIKYLIDNMSTDSYTYASCEKTRMSRRFGLIRINQKPTPLILFNKLKQGDLLIGQGASKKVKLAMDLEGKCYASFSFAYQSYEIENLNLLKDVEGFVKAAAIFYYESKKGPQKCRIIQEYYDEGTLYVKELDRTNLLTIFLKITKALHILHTEYCCVHRDLKPTNILVRKKNNSYDADIADLETICNFTKDDENLKKFRTTTWSVSPELAAVYYEEFFVPANTKKLEDNENAQESNTKNEENPIRDHFPETEKIVKFIKPFLDMWSLGVIIYQGLTKELLAWNNKYNQVNLHYLSDLGKTFKILKQQDLEACLGFKTLNFLRLTIEQQGLIRMLLNPCYEKRSTAEQVIEYMEKNWTNLIKPFQKIKPFI